MNRFDPERNSTLLTGSLSRHGYMRWWHSFRGVSTLTGLTRTFFVEYSILNPALASDMAILGQRPYNRRREQLPSYLCIKAGAFPVAGSKDAAADDAEEGAIPTGSEAGKQLQIYLAPDALSGATDPMYYRMGDCILSESRISGHIDVPDSEAAHRYLMTDAGSMSWDLEIHKAVACHTGFIAGKLFTALHALESFWHAEGIRSFYRGTVTLDGEEYEVTEEDSYGYADKHWGRSYNRPWLQLASCHLVSERTGKVLKHSALAIDGCCPKFLIFPLRRRLLIQFTYMGEDFEYHYAKPLTLPRSKWRVKETNKRFLWHIKAQNRTSVLRVSAAANKEDLERLWYESPSGHVSKRPLLAGGDGTAVIELYRRTREGLVLIDRLHALDCLCAYQKDK